MGLTIGLTGGIASGKSTVSNMLKKLGYKVIDADIIAREVVEVGKPSYYRIIDTFGEGILQRDCSINREKLGALIFQDENKRLQLNNIVHPAIRKNMIEQRDIFFASGVSTVILDIPLLFESKLTYLVDKTIVVYVNKTVQLERLIVRNSLSIEEAEARIQSQMPLSEKKRLADEVIDNNGTIEETMKQLKDILKNWNISITP